MSRFGCAGGQSIDAILLIIMEFANSLDDGRTPVGGA